MKRKRICILTYSFYEYDTRVFRYGESLAQRGDEVDVLSLGSVSEGVPELIDGCRVTRIQERKIEEKAVQSFIKPLLLFLWRASRHISREHHRRPYDLLHIHNIPDFLVFAGWRPKLSGAALILDIHDLVPELYCSKFGAPATSLKIHALKWMERASAAFADHIILANHLWLSTYTSRSAPAKKCSVWINNVENRVFFPRARTRQDGRKIIIFPGSLQWHQGVDLAIRAFQKVAREMPEAEFHIYGEGQAKPGLVALTEQLGLADRVLFSGFIPTKEVAELMANADLGVVPKRADSFGNEAYSTKIMEFMALGVPVVVSRTKIDQFYFNDGVVKFFESGNVEALADAMLEVLRDPALRQRLVTHASAYAHQHSWETRKQDYFDLVDRLTPASPASR